MANPDEMTNASSPRRSRRTLSVALAALVVAAVTAAAMWAHFAAPNTAKYQPLLAQLASGQLQAEANGRVDLSQSFPGLTPHDEAFITRRDDGSFVALLPTDYPKGIAIAGLLYTSRPLQIDDTYVRTSGTALDRRYVDAGPWRGLSIDARVDEHWYRVSKGVR
jgi:hypothetical protein